tara:strand:+ start:2868 stop:3299 length:432 start_codon:yes stop_codon:yes gene_type:complete
MDILVNKYRSSHKLLNFNHLMQIYEKNYQLLMIALEFISDQQKTSTILLKDNLVLYEPISVSKYTNIFRLYHKFKHHANSAQPSSYSLKPHLIYTLYKDAKLLEAKTLKESREFHSQIDNKIAINLGVYNWLKYMIEKKHIYQ